MLWLRDGKLLINGDGHLIDCEECPCPGNNPGYPCCDEVLSEELPGRVQFTFMDESTSDPIDFVTEYDAGTNKWSGTAACGASTIRFTHYCEAQDPPFDPTWWFEVYCDDVLIFKCLRSFGCVVNVGGGNVSHTTDVDAANPTVNLPYECCGNEIGAATFGVDDEGGF